MQVLRAFFGRARLTARRIFFVTLIIAIIVLLVLGYLATHGGIPGRYAVLSATNYDYLNPLESIAIGTLTLYTRNVHDMGFCTSDRELLEAAHRYANRNLFIGIEYRSINTGDVGSYGCDPGTDKITIYHITRIFLTAAGEAENRMLEQINGWEHDPFYEAPPDKRN